MTRVLMVGILITFLAVSCQQLDRFTQFDLPYSTSFTIPSTLGITLPINITSPPVTTNIEQVFSSNNANLDLVESVTLKELTLTLTSPANGDFSFLDRITLYIDADGLDEQEIATKDPVPSGVGTELTFDVSGVDLKEYIKADEFTLRIQATKNQPINGAHEVKADMVFNVDAQLLGV